MIQQSLIYVLVAVLFAIIIGYGYLLLVRKSATENNEEEEEIDTSADNEFDNPNASRDPPKRIVAYYTNWSRYRKGAEYLPKDVPVDYVTDIVYAFFPINDDGYVRYSDPWADINQKGIAEIIALRGTGRVKRVLFSIGGWTYSGPEKKKWYLDEKSKEVVNTKPFQQIWSEILANVKTRDNFITSAIEMMTRHDFDGIDIDYEYPACPQGDCRPEYAAQAKQFVVLLSELRAKLGKYKLITLATAAADKNLLAGPNMKQVCDIVDYLNVMTYDYFVWTEGAKSGHNQPKRNTADGFNVNHTLWRYIKLGCDPQKLNIGVACYGRGFKVSQSDFKKAVANKRFTNIQSIASSHPSKWTQEKGVVSFYELKNEYPNGRSAFVNNQGSWLYDSASSELISYTDLLDLKDINEIRIRKRIGGVLIYAVDQDDYSNLNGYGRYPILSNLLSIDALNPTSNLVPAK